MRMFLKASAIALALVGATFATTGASCADGFAISTSNHSRDHARTGVAFSFGDVAFGYQDGYWDNGHRWHKWRNRGDHDNYRDQYHDNYRSGRVFGYRHHGWQRD